MQSIPHHPVKNQGQTLSSLEALPTSKCIQNWVPASEAPLPQSCPLFSTHIPAGFPSPASDYIESGLDLNTFMVTHPSATYYVRVSGDSMVEANIVAGDYLVVDRAIDPFNGAIVVAAVDGELTVKRLYRQGSRVELHPENPAYKPIILKGESELLIFGVVRGVVRKTI